MFDMDNILNDADMSFTINKQFTTNPITSGSSGSSFNFISKKIENFSVCNDPESKPREISEMVDHINSFTELEIQSLMANNNEIIRGIAARAYVEKFSGNIIENLKTMLNDTREVVRESAVISLCYINSPDVLDDLEKAAGDDSASIKLRALTGIADIASEYSSEKAKRILRTFKADRNKEVREFVNDELSILV